MLSIVNAKYLNNYSIRLTFNNGKSGTVDLKKIVFKDPRPIFKPLKEKDYFKKFSLKYDTVVWENQLDCTGISIFSSFQK